jgi:hypothetical protein
VSYTPQPGTIPFRVIQHLQSLPSGTPASTAELAEALEIAPNSLPPIMRAALNAGLVMRKPFQTLAGRCSHHWTLGAGAAEDEVDDDPVVQRTVPAVRFNATLWDGSMILTGLPVREDGAVILNPAQIARLRELVVAA